MKKARVPDTIIAKTWKKNDFNYAAAGREVGIKRQSFRQRVLQLRAQGWDLPESRPAGYTLTSERAREIAHMRKTKC